MTNPSEIVLYEGFEEWSALYIRGELHTVGDHYWVQEQLLHELGIETVQSNDFLRGGNTREEVAKTLREIEDYQASLRAVEVEVEKAEAELRDAEKKLAEAQRKVKEARQGD